MSFIATRTWVLLQLLLVFVVSTLTSPSMALVSPIYTTRSVTSSSTKCCSLPEDQQDSQELKGPPENISGIETQFGTEIQSSQEDNNDNILLGSLFENTDMLEVRLDATLCAIFVMARFLLYDMTLPRKEVPGMEIVDVVAVLDTFSAAGALAILWSIAGIGVGLFDSSSSSNDNDSSSDLSLLAQLFGTTALSVPLWILLEKIFHWPSFARLDGTSLVEAMVLSSLGLLGTMLIGRTTSRFLP